MANDYIKITQAGRPQLGSQVIRLANLLREVRDLADAVNDAAGHMHDGVTYTTVETNFGLSGGGSNFVSLLQNTHDILNTNTTVAGVDRLSRLDEFVARLAGQ